MKIYISLCILLLIFSNKDISGLEVAYIVKPRNESIENDRKLIEDGMAIHFRGVDEDLKNLEYQLFVSNDYVYFEQSKSKSTSVASKLITEAIAGRNYYCYQKQFYTYKKIDNNIFCVNVESDFDWKLQNEFKFIENFKCYKAVTYTNLTPEKKIKIEAWFTPEIPVSYGPRNFNGLPGLILELSDDKVTFCAKSINFNKEIKNVKIDTFSKRITQLEFDLLIEKANENMKDLIKN